MTRSPLTFLRELSGLKLCCAGFVARQTITVPLISIHRFGTLCLALNRADFFF